VQVQLEKPGIELFADLPFDPAGGMEEGGAGEYPDQAVEKGGRDDGESEPCRRVSSLGRFPDAVDGELQQPGDRQGKGIGADQEQGAEEVAAPVFQKVLF
jgi:hypothetical protein